MVRANSLSSRCRQICDAVKVASMRMDCVGRRARVAEARTSLPADPSAKIVGMRQAIPVVYAGSEPGAVDCEADELCVWRIAKVGAPPVAACAGAVLDGLWDREQLQRVW